MPAGTAIGIALALLVILASAMPVAAAVTNLRMAEGSGSDKVWRGDTITVSGDASKSGAEVTFWIVDSDGDQIQVEKQVGTGTGDTSDRYFTFNIDLSQHTWQQDSDSDGMLTAGTATVYAEENDGDGDWSNADTSTTFEAVDSPALVGAQTVDSDGDGNVDQIRVEFSESITDTSLDTSDFTVSAGSVPVESVDTGTNTLDPYAVVHVSDISGTAATPDVTLAADGIADRNENPGPSTATTVTAVDGASPVVTSVEWDDTEPNGDIDTARLTFSESVDVTDSNGAGDGLPAFTITGPDGTVAIDVKDYSTTGVTSLQLTFTGSQVDTTATPNLKIGYDATNTASYVVETGGTDGDGTGTGTDGTDDELDSGSDIALSNVDSAEPIIDALVTRDTDKDGKVDRLDVTLSETIDSASVETEDFSISDPGGLAGTLDSATTATGSDDDTLHVTITESTGADPYDTDATPTLGYSTTADSDSTDVADLASNFLASTTKTATDAAAPAVVDATTRDTDANGDLDTIDVTLSEPLADGTSTFSTDTFSISNPAGTVTGASTGANQNDDAATMTVSDITGTSATPDVTLAAGTLSDGSNTLDSAQTFTGTGDGAAPVVETVLTRDTDADGRIDRLDVILSEKIDHSSIESGDFSLSSTVYTGDGIQGVATDSESTNSKTLHVSLVESPDTYDTEATPDLTYAQSGSTDVADLAGNALGDVASGDVSEADGASPVVTEATWKDTESTPNGDIDTVTLTFSEPVDALDSGSSDGFLAITIRDASGTAHSIDAGTYTLSATTTLTLPFTNDQRDTTGITGLTVDYATGTTAHVVEKGGFAESSADSTNDEVDAGADVALSNVDSADPIIETVVTHDTDKNGQLDQLEVTLSEAVASGSVETDDFSIANSDTYSGTGIEAVVTESGDDDTVLVTLAQGSTPDTDATPTLEYSSADSDSTDVADLAGNPLASTTKTATDGAAPVIVASSTGDSNADGDLDTIDVTLSEPLADDASTFSNAFSLSAGTVDAAGTGSSAGDDALSLTVSGVVGTSATPDVTLDAGKLADASGNTLASAATFTGIADGAAPVVQTISTIDADADGNVDGATVVASEAIDDGTLSLSGWSMGGKSIEAVDTGSTSDDGAFRVRVTSDEKEFDGTAVTPDVIYSSGSVGDAAGNDLRDVASEDVSETDGVAPEVTSVATTNSAGQTIEFSVTSGERLDVTEATVSGPESATLTGFSESGSGPYTYTATYQADTGGTYTVTLARATDAAGNDGASGQSDSVNVPESLEPETTTSSGSGGGGGSGGFSTTTTTTTSTPTPTPTPTETETPTPTPDEPIVDVVRSASGDEATVRVSDPRAGEPVTIPGDDSGPLVASRNVTVDSLDVTVDDSRDYTMKLSLTDVTPVATPALGTQTGQASLGYLDVDHSSSENVTGTTIEFRVNRSVLGEFGVTDSEVTLYQYDDGTWGPVETLYVGGNRTYAAYTADTTGVETFAFGVPTSQFVVRSITLESATIEADETATIEATIANTGEKDATHNAWLYAGGEYVRTVSVTIPAGERRTVTFEPTFEEPGTYPLAVNSYDGPTLAVESAETTTSDGTNQSNLSSLASILPAWLWLVMFFVVVGLVAAAIERWSQP